MDQGATSMFLINNFQYYLIIPALLFFITLNAKENEKWEAPEFVEGAKTLNLQQAKKLHTEGIKFVDVRSDRQYEKRHIPTALHLSIKTEFTEANLLKYFKKDTPFVLYCNSVRCSQSYRATKKAVSWGFTNVKYYRNGFRAWRLDGNKLEYGKKDKK